MRGTMKYTFFALLAMAVLIGCTDHRDLHVAIKPMFVIKNDWSVARLAPESATAMLFARPDPCVLMHSNASRHCLYLDPDKYNILVFNEAMVSPDLTGLDGIVYRGTEEFGSFGAYVRPTPVNPVFRSDPEEVMVGYGYPEPLATRAFEEKEVAFDKQHVLKYQNGKNGFPEYADFEADSIELLPVRVTREVKVIAHVKNLQSQFRMSATLRGFAEGVLLASRQPDGADAAYTFDLNSAVADPQVEGGYIIQSPLFTTFGPWWNDYPGTHKYVIDFISTKGGGIVQNSFDVTESNGVTVTQSVGEAILRIQEEEALFLKDGTPPAMEAIVIEVWFELPTGGDDSIDVDLGDWGTDIIIPIPIGQ